ncbi:hypothetical protein [Microbacterium sp.]|uniref:hypothetical protein n=1 Tax=Microbacterium sp. TaxID=51671 RepID=UPI0032421E4D
MTEMFTLAHAVAVLDEMELNFAHLLGVANIDVADEYGDDAAEPRHLFLAKREEGGDRATIYGRRLARMLIERLVQEYHITSIGEEPKPADSVQADADSLESSGIESSSVDHTNGRSER